MRLLKYGSVVLVLALAVGVAAASETEKGYIGVSLVSVQNVGGSSEQNGLYVDKVFPGSAAELAGIRSHDRIVAVDGMAVANMDDLQQAMGEAGVGDPVTLGIRRDGVDSDLTVVLGEDPGLHTKRFGVVLGEQRAFIGVHVQELGPQLATYFEVEGGVLITEVTDDGPAAKAGLRAGDVLLEIDGSPLDEHGALHRLIGSAEKGQQLDVRVQRRGQLMSFFVEADSRENHSHTLDLRKHELHGILESESAEGTFEIVVPHEAGKAELHRHKIRELHEQHDSAEDDDPADDDN